MDKNKAISYFEKVIRDTDQVLPHCSEALRAELLEQRGYYELALEALRPAPLYGLKYPDPDGKAGLHKLGWVAYAYPPAHIAREVVDSYLSASRHTYQTAAPGGKSPGV